MFKKKIFVLILIFVFLAFPVCWIIAADADTNFEKGISYFDQGDYEKALTAFQSALQEKPDLAEAYYNMGIIYDIQEKFPEAINAYKWVIQIDPNVGEVLKNIAIDCYLTGNLKESMYYITLAGSMGKPVDNSLYNRISTEYAREAKGTIISLDQLDPMLSKQLKAEIDTLEKGLEKKAASSEDVSADLLALGTRYRRIGNIKKAIETLTRAIETDKGNNYMVNAELSLCYFLNGQNDLFIKHFKEAKVMGFKPSLSLFDLHSWVAAKN
ncbi:tetratricopeptide repeat protein [bacterium]|nr:tetratricopeptide repeat protein [bacterium]